MNNHKIYIINKNMYTDIIDLISDSNDTNNDQKNNDNKQDGGKKTKIVSNDNIELIPTVSTSKNFIKLDFPNINVSQVEYSDGPVFIISKK